jgi:hypothetical protein
MGGDFGWSRTELAACTFDIEDTSTTLSTGFSHLDHLNVSSLNMPTRTLPQSPSMARPAAMVQKIHIAKVSL